MMRNADATAVAGEKVRDDLERLRSDLKSLRDDFLSLKDHGMAAARVHARSAGQHVGRTARQLLDQGRNARDQAAEHIVERPLASVGIALGVGMLMGAIIGRMR